MRTAIAELVLQAARRVLQEHAEGRSVDPLRLDWALFIVAANPLPSRPASAATAAPVEGHHA